MFARVGRRLQAPSRRWQQAIFGSGSYLTEYNRKRHTSSSVAREGTVGVVGPPVAYMSSLPSSALGTATTSSPASMECRWDSCGSSHSDACALLAHVAEVHIGRRSRQNLSLVCKWPDCSRSSQPFAKRDHIISHMRVHIHYKPFYCELCFKMFKRPQDLKKHLGIHAASKTSVGKGEHVGFQQAKQFPTSVASGAGYLDAFNMGARGWFLLHFSRSFSRFARNELTSVSDHV